MRRLFFVGLVALAGCSNLVDVDKIDGPPLDECTMAPEELACVTLHLRGTEALDTAQVDARFDLAGTRVTRRIVSHAPNGAVKPPIALGVVMTQNAGPDVDLMVLATSGGKIVGYGGVYLSGFYPMKHLDATVHLQPTGQSRCFDGIKDGDESDVDCGSFECVACVVGNRCRVTRDCANSSCVMQPTGELRCQ